MTDYVVIYEQAEDGGWGAYFPDIPGCIALGETLEAVSENIRGAVSLYADEMRRNGTPMPDPTSKAGVVSVDLLPIA